MNDSQDSIIELIHSFAVRCGPHRVVDLVDALTAYRGDHIAALIEALKDEDDEVRLVAIEVLATMAEEAEPALPNLIEALSDPDRLVRIAAVYAVVNFGYKAIAAAPILTTWLDCGDDFSEVTAAAAIIQIDPSRVDDVLPVLIDGLDSDYGIQCHAAWSIGQLGAVAREAVSALIRIQGKESTLDRLANEAIVNITSQGH